MDGLCYAAGDRYSSICRRRVSVGLYVVEDERPDLSIELDKLGSFRAEPSGSCSPEFLDSLDNIFAALRTVSRGLFNKVEKVTYTRIY